MGLLPILDNVPGNFFGPPFFSTIIQSFLSEYYKNFNNSSFGMDEKKEASLLFDI